MAFIARNPVALVALLWFWSMPTMALALPRYWDITANVSVLNMPSFLEHRSLQEPPRLSVALADDLRCEPTPSKCAQESRDGCKDEWYFDTSSDAAMVGAKTFCDKVARKYEGKKAPIGLISKTVDDGKIVDTYDNGWKTWQIGVEDVQGCDTGAPERWVYKPTFNHDCYAILYGAWRQCDNKGRGGSVQAGCLNYSMTPAKPTEGDLAKWVQPWW